jgi:uroporphyrin-III C-methyltransferase/precorrin-2 dehydrogenase/sirohydrochlorin ferrochelatase
MSLFPAFLKLTNRRVLVVGGGSIAAQKISGLLEAGAQVHVVSPKLATQLSECVRNQQITWSPKPFEAADLDGAFLVIAATSLRDLNAHVFAEAEQRNILCNAVDDIDHCHFYYGSIVQRGDLQIAISTNGKSPALAQRLRKELEQQFGPGYQHWLEWLGAARETLRAQSHDPELTKRALHFLASKPMFKHFLDVGATLGRIPNVVADLQVGQPGNSSPKANEPVAAADRGRRLSRSSTTPQQVSGPSDSDDAGFSSSDSATGHRSLATGRASSKVFLLGAGPGDPELLTLKALRILQSADVVLHDSLISPEILNLIPPSAERIDVGKRAGFRLLTQSDINSLLLSNAAKHKTVVRLKGGDPLLFGRAAEEIQALREAHIDFEVVPGISAAFGAAAAAKVSLTDRRLSSHVLFTTFSRAPEAKFLPGIGLTTDTTVVVYMPGPDYSEVSRWLQDAAVSPDTPVLVISKASHPDQSQQATTVAGLTQIARLPAPALLLVGRVASSAEAHTTFSESATTQNFLDHTLEGGLTNVRIS